MSLYRRSLLAVSPFHVADVGVSSAGLGIGLTTHKLAVKFFPPVGTAVSKVDLRVAKTGTITGQNFKMEIQSDNNDAPSGTVLGTATGEFAGPGANGFLGMQALGSNTGALSLNTAYWLVISWSSGSSPDAGNFLDLSVHNTLATPNGMSKCRKHNGTDWTTVTANARLGAAVFECTDGTTYGLAIDSSQTQSGQTDIHGSNRQGLRLRFGCAVRAVGAVFRLNKVGTPSSLVVELYEGSVLKTSGTLAAAWIASTSNTWTSVQFDPPVQVAANTDLSIVFRQSSDGGDDSNDYDLYGVDIPSGYLGTVQETTTRYVYGTGSDPAAFSADDTFHAFVGLFTDDTSSDLAGSEGFTGTVINRGIH